MNPLFAAAFVATSAFAQPTLFQNIAELRHHVAPKSDSVGPAAIVEGYYQPGDGGGGTYLWVDSNTGTDNGGTIIQPDTKPRYGRWILEIRDGTVSVDQFGAVGNGARNTNDTPFINSAIAWANGMPTGGIVTFSRSKIYTIRTSGLHQTGIRWLPKVSLEGNGATLLLEDNCAFINSCVEAGKSYTVTGVVAKGATTFPVAETSGLLPGQVVALRWLQDPNNPEEPQHMIFARVISLAGNSITLDHAAPAALDPAVTPSKDRTIISIPEPLDSQFCRNFQFVQDNTNQAANAEEGINIIFCRNLSISNITASDPGAGTINGQFCDNIRCDNITTIRSCQQHGQGSKGRAISFSTSSNCTFRNIHATECQGDPIFLEAYCRNMLFDGVFIDNNWTYANRSPGPTTMVGCENLQSAHFQNLLLVGNGTNVCVFNPGGGSAYYTYSDLYINTDQEVLWLSLSEWNGGRLDVGDGNTYLFQNIRRRQYAVSFADNWSGHRPNNFQLPSGLLLDWAYWTNSTSGIKRGFLLGVLANTPIPTPITAFRRYDHPASFGANYRGTPPQARSLALYSEKVAPGTEMTFELLDCPRTNSEDP